MLEGPISTGFSNKLNNFDSNNGIPTSKNTILNKQNQMWTSKEKKKKYSSYDERITIYIVIHHSKYYVYGILYICI